MFPYATMHSHSCVSNHGETCMFISAIATSQICPHCATYNQACAICVRLIVTLELSS